MVGIEYEQYLTFKELDLSKPEQEELAIKMTLPKDEEDEKRVFNWCKAIAWIAGEEKKQELRQKALLCINNLLKSNDRKWEYWEQYGWINEKMDNYNEAIKGFDNAIKANPPEQKKNYLQETKIFLEDHTK